MIFIWGELRDFEQMHGIRAAKKKRTSKTLKAVECINNENVVK